MQIITPESYPSNIAVFQADDFASAMVQASVAMEQDNIQGAVWHDPTFQEAPFIPDKYLTKAFLQYAMNRNLRLRMKQKVAGDIEVDAFNMFDHRERPDFLYDTCTKVFELAMGYARDMAVVDFLVTNETIGLEIHRDAFGVGKEIPSIEGDFFPCKAVRMVRTINGPGTAILNPEDQDEDVLTQVMEEGYSKYFSTPAIRNVWHVATGDTLFIADVSWGEQKALLHGEPEWETPADMSQARATLISTIY